jgi:protein-S-isoprenylcysteine O-methyltransferase Ste14
MPLLPSAREGPMTGTHSVDPAAKPAPPPRPRVERMLRAWNALVFAAWATVPFLVAGIGWRRGWLHLAALAIAVIAHGRYVAHRNPGLRERRSRIHPGTKPWDLWWNALFWPLLASVAVTAAFEVRGGGSLLPGWTWPLGLGVLAAGFALSGAAMAANPFFEGVVRIQREVGHRTIEGGPYRLIRHPGYAGLALWALAIPLLLGSAWAFAPALSTVAWVVLRTALEDALLRRELPGHADYARRVKWRLVPGLW